MHQITAKFRLTSFNSITKLKLLLNHGNSDFGKPYKVSEVVVFVLFFVTELLFLLWVSDEFVRQFSGREIIIVGNNGIFGVNSDATIGVVSSDQLRSNTRVPPGIRLTVVRIEADTFALHYSGQFNYFLSIGSSDVLLRKNLDGDETFTLARDHDNYGIRTVGPNRFLSIGSRDGIVSRPNFDGDEKFRLFVLN